MTKTETPFHTINTPVELSLERVRGLLCSAFEGGSNYWIDHLEVVLPEGLNHEDFQEGGKFADPDDYWPSNQIIPFHEGCGLKVILSDEDDTDDLTVREINIETMKDGLERMSRWGLNGAEGNNKHWQDFLNENDDAITADVFLQFVVLGDVIFG